MKKRGRTALLPIIVDGDAVLLVRLWVKMLFGTNFSTVRPSRRCRPPNPGYLSARTVVLSPLLLKHVEVSLDEVVMLVAERPQDGHCPR